jgi:hypothetical protein
VALFARSDETTYAVCFAVIANRTVPSATTFWSIPDFGGGGPMTRCGLNVEADAGTGGHWPEGSAAPLIFELDSAAPEWSFWPVQSAPAFTGVSAVALALSGAGVAALEGDEAASTASPRQPVRKVPSVTSATAPKTALFAGKRLSPDR